MSRNIQFRTPKQENEARLVEGMADKNGVYNMSYTHTVQTISGTTTEVCSLLTRRWLQRFYKIRSSLFGRILKEKKSTLMMES